MIRKFTAEDLDDVLKLFQSVVHTVGAKYYDEEHRNAWAPAELNQDKWLHNLMTNFTLVAEVDGRIVGFGDMTYHGYVDHLFVAKDFQGQGVALKLMRGFESEARRLKIPELTSDVSIIAKTPAERFGFEVIKEEVKQLRGKEFTIYKMRKGLS